MQYGELIDFLQNVGKDPSRLIFEDELTGLHNRRFLHSYIAHKVHWDREDSFPLSLLVTDVDLFKDINDTYGHDGGDEALVFIAGLLREVAGDSGYPIRFGGDEFMILLPKTELGQAVQRAHRLHQLTKERTLRLAHDRGELTISLSIGVAAARTDATTGNDLIRIADTALYTSKQMGRNRVSVASDIDAEKTYRKTALHRLNDAEIAGRSRELSAVSEALGSLSLGKSKFVVIEGAPGMGKSTVIETIRGSLESNDALHVVRVAGQQQEGYRPYYVLGHALVALLNRRADNGVSVLDTLDDNELHYLGHVLPHLNGLNGLSGRGANVNEDQVQRREGIFITLVQLIGKLLERKPLVLLIDDLHFADEASLVLLRTLFMQQELSLLVCGTVTGTVVMSQMKRRRPGFGSSKVTTTRLASRSSSSSRCEETTSPIILPAFSPESICRPTSKKTSLKSPKATRFSLPRSSENSSSIRSSSSSVSGEPSIPPKRGTFRARSTRSFPRRSLPWTNRGGVCSKRCRH